MTFVKSFGGFGLDSLLGLVLVGLALILGTRPDVAPDRSHRISEFVSFAPIHHVSGIGLDSREVQFSITGSNKKRWLLFFFSPKCPACLANRRNWQLLTSTLYDEFGILAIPVDGSSIIVRKFMQPFTHKVPVLRHCNLLDREEFQNLHVPATFLLDSAGQVQFFWEGDLTAHRYSLKSQTRVSLLPWPLSIFWDWRDG